MSPDLSGDQPQRVGKALSRAYTQVFRLPVMLPRNSSCNFREFNVLYEFRFLGNQNEILISLASAAGAIAHSRAPVRSKLRNGVC